MAASEISGRNRLQRRIARPLRYPRCRGDRLGTFVRGVVLSCVLYIYTVVRGVGATEMGLVSRTNVAADWYLRGALFKPVYVD